MVTMIGFYLGNTQVATIIGKQIAKAKATMVTMIGFYLGNSQVATIAIITMIGF